MLSLPRGTSDFNPEDAILLKEIQKKIEAVYQNYGFYPIETPSLELLETLSAKAYGDENAKELYVIEGKIDALRYDLTVPLARYVSMNKDIVLPFKRYQIGTVWRMDEPQKMRDREFFQADIDIIGNTDITAEAELISATAMALDSIGIKNSTILINSRVLLEKIMEYFGINSKLHIPSMRIIDKLQKMGKEETKRQLAKLGIDDKVVTELLELITSKMGNEEKLSTLNKKLQDSNSEIEKLSKLLLLLKTYSLKNYILIDLSLARGMDYYTGTVWEFIVVENEKQLPTLASGGRYDKLISNYLKRDIPAVGSSIGVSRVFDVIEKTKKKTYALVYVANIGKENLEYALSVTNTLRKAGINTDINLLDRGVTKQLDYANSLKIPYVLMIGSIEKAANKAKLRDMSSGEESMLDLDSLVNILKSKKM